MGGGAGPPDPLPGSATQSDAFVSLSHQELVQE